MCNTSNFTGHFSVNFCPKTASETISEGLKFKNFLGGMPPDSPSSALRAL